MTITLHPGSVPLKTLETIYWTGEAAKLDAAFDAGIEKAAARIAEIAAGDEPVYGINTGFGKLASIKIAPADVATLQRNLILSHCCGVGEPLDAPTTRLMMALKLLSIGRGASGIRWETIAREATTPLRLTASIQSLSLMPSFSASCTLIQIA